MDDNLPKWRIIRRRALFKQLFRSGKKVSAHGITSFTIDYDTRMVAFHISTKAGKAVQRNKIRRRLKEIYRRKQTLFPDNTATVFAVYKPLENTGYRALEGAMTEIAHKIRAIYA